MASGPSYMFLSILIMLMLITVKGGVASSRFLSDFGLCIVDTQLDFPTMRAGLFRTPRRRPLRLIYETDPVVERGTAATYDDQSGKIENNDDEYPIRPFPRTRRSAFSTANIALDLADFDPQTVNIGDGYDSTKGVYLAPFGGSKTRFRDNFALLHSFLVISCVKQDWSRVNISGLYVLHLAATFTTITDDSDKVRPVLALTVNGDTRADQIPALTFATYPVIERGTAATYDKHLGKIKIYDHGTYLFIIHRVGVSINNDPLLLQFKNSAYECETLVEIMDNGDRSSFSTHVLAELKKGDIVFINHRSEDVIGDEDNPFIFSSFLLYHSPITSFPRARQSAFSVPAIANLSIGDSIIDDFDLPTVNIGYGFDSLTGIFTAPFGGLYVFHLGVTFILLPNGRTTGRALLALTVNGDTIAQVNGFFPDLDMSFRYAPVAPPPNNAITVAQDLDQGDMVFLKNIIPTEDIEGKVMFVGYLLS